MCIVSSDQLPAGNVSLSVSPCHLNSKRKIKKGKSWKIIFHENFPEDVTLGIGQKVKDYGHKAAPSL